MSKYISFAAPDELIDEVIEHRAENGYTYTDYFKFLAPIMSGSSMETFLNRFHLKDWTFILPTLSNESLDRYMGAYRQLITLEEHVAAIEAKKDDQFDATIWGINDRPTLQRIQTALEKVVARLKDLPDDLNDAYLNQGLAVVIARKARIEALQQRIQQLIETNNAKVADAE